MGLFDRFIGKATAAPNALLPPPLIQRQTSYFTGTGNGDFWSLLTRNLPGSSFNWRNQAGDLMLNSIVAIGMDWYIRNWSQGVPVVRRPMPDGQVETVADHPILQLLAQPTPNVPPSLVWSWILPDYQLLGNAYFRKVRVSGRVVGLQYLAADMMRPVGNKINPLIKYQYTVDGTSYDIALEDLIHIRYGRDPQDSRFGRSPVTSVLREIATDNVAASAAFGMVRNGGMPSIMVGPDYKGGVEDLSEDDARQTKRKLQQDFTGDVGCLWRPSCDFISHLDIERLEAEHVLGETTDVLTCCLCLLDGGCHRFEALEVVSLKNTVCPAHLSESSVLTVSELVPVALVDLIDIRHRCQSTRIRSMDGTTSRSPSAPCA